VRLRVKDLDFQYLQVTVRDGKGGKDRVTPLADSLVPALREHLERVRTIYDSDRREGLAGVWLPFALERKYPKAGTDWAWQWVSPSQSVSRDPRGRITDAMGRNESDAVERIPTRRRHHLDPGTVDKALRVAVGKAAVGKRVTSHTFRHSFATHLLQRGQELIRSRPLAHPFGASPFSRIPFAASQAAQVGRSRNYWATPT
jgi:integrase